MDYDKRQKETTSVKEIKSVERLEKDYYRRLGNILLGKISYIQKNEYKYDTTKKHKSNDKRIKRGLAISRRKIGKSLDQMITSFCTMFELVRSKSSDRLQEIEKETQEEYLREQERIKQEEAIRQQIEEEVRNENIKEEIEKDSNNYNSR